MGASLSFWNWDFEPTVTFGLILLAVLYVQARRKNWFPDNENVKFWLPSARWRPWCFAAGLVTICIALESPIDYGGDRFLLSIHMVQHLLLMMVAPPLLLLGIAGAAPLDRFKGRVWRAWLLLTRPWPACILFNATLLVWHVPALYNTTLTVTPLHVFEHITFIVVGVIFWWPLVDPVRHSRYRRIGPFEKIAVLGVAGIPPTVLGFLRHDRPAGRGRDHVRRRQLGLFCCDWRDFLTSVWGSRRRRSRCPQGLGRLRTILRTDSLR